MAIKVFSSEGKHRPAECPTCGTKLDAYSCLSDESGKKTPRPGDMTICTHCVSILIFTKNMNLRDASKSEEKRIMNNPVIAMAITELRKKWQMKNEATTLPPIGRIDVWKR